MVFDQSNGKGLPGICFYFCYVFDIEILDEIYRHYLTTIFILIVAHKIIIWE